MFRLFGSYYQRVMPTHLFHVSVFKYFSQDLGGD